MPRQTATDSCVLVRLPFGHTYIEMEVTFSLTVNSDQPLPVKVTRRVTIDV
jgi:hypothetical protein